MNVRRLYLLFGIPLFLFGILFFLVALTRARGSDASSVAFIATIIFLGAGLVLLFLFLFGSIRILRIKRLGKGYACKIRGYVIDDHQQKGKKPSLIVEVGFLDEEGYEMRAQCRTKGVHYELYPVGMSAMVYILDGIPFLDPGSVTTESVYAEEMLMDDSKKMGAVVWTTCLSCGASLYEICGDVFQCPYCGAYGSPDLIEGGGLIVYEE